MNYWKITYPSEIRTVRNTVLPTFHIISPDKWIVAVYGSTAEDLDPHMIVFEWNPIQKQSQLLPLELRLHRSGMLREAYGYLWLVGFADDKAPPNLWAQIVFKLEALH